MQDNRERGSQVWRTVGLYGIIAVLAGLYLFSFVRVLTWCPDEGSYLYASQRVAEGAIPGRDFVEANAPGAFYWLAWFFELFGTTMQTARTVLLLTGVATTVLVFHLSRRAGGVGLFAAAFALVIGIPLMVMNSPHYDSNLFALGAFSVFLAAERGLGKQAKSHGWLFVTAGLLTGWVSCILQQKGFLFAAAFVIALCITQRRQAIRPAALIFVGYVSVLVAEVGFYAYKGALPDLFFTTVKLPLSNYQNLNAAPYGFLLWTVMFPRWFAFFKTCAPTWVATPLAGVFGAPFLLIVGVPFILAILAYVWRREAFRKELIPFWLASYALWISELHRQDIGHLRNGCLLLVVLFFALCERFGKELFTALTLMVTLGIVLNGGANLVGAMSARTVLNTRRGSLMAQEKDSALEFLLSHTRPGDYAFVFPYHPLYYFLAEVRNPTRFNVLIYDHKGDPHFDEALRDLEQKKPHYALSDTVFAGDALRTLFPAYRPPSPQDQVIDRYLDTHYHQVAFENGFRILERNP